MKLLLIILFLCLNAHCETQVFEAIAKFEGQVAYIERHTVVFEEETVIKSLTEYLDQDGKPIGSMQSDFTHSLAAPNFVFRDKRHRSLQGLRWNRGETEVFAQERGEKRVVKRVLTPGENILIGGEGLVFYIASNMQKIISKNGLDFMYVIPGRLEAYHFFIKPLAHNSEQAEFEVKMKSWLMSFFSPRLKLIYDVQKKRLKSFEGLSNLRNSEGEMMSVDIQYLYQN